MKIRRTSVHPWSNFEMLHEQIILDLIEECKRALRAGFTVSDIRSRLLADKIKLIIDETDTKDFLEWLKQDRQFCYYYYDAEQSGVCAKPREAAALIVESIVMDALE